jgi:hypothetical protein
MSDSICPKSLLGILRRALAYGAEALPRYSCASSKHDFTQPQLFACLVYKHYRRRTYREACEDLRLAPAVLELLGLTKVPHYSTLSKFASRVLSAATFEHALACVLRDVQPTQEVASMDSSGLGKSIASAYYRMRQGKSNPALGFVKVSAMVLKGSLLPCGVAVGTGPCNDKTDVPELVRQAQRQRVRPGALLADKAYDSEELLRGCWEDWKVPTYIPLHRVCKDGSARGKYRSLMTHLPKLFGQRWQAETYFSGLKRTTGSTVTARKPHQQSIAAWLHVFAYALRR